MNFIDRIFIGELTSTVMCEECANVGTQKFTSTRTSLQSHCFISFTYNYQQPPIFICDK